MLTLQKAIFNLKERHIKSRINLKVYRDIQDKIVSYIF